MLSILVPMLISCTALDDLFGKDDRLKAGSMTSAVTEDGQLYNMSFDLWSQVDGDWVCYDSLATSDQKAVWGSANASTSSFGKPTCVPDSVMVAVEGRGKNAVKLKTQVINALVTKKLAAGSIFTGSMGNTNLVKMTATLNWGIPFTLRPKALEGFAFYMPKKINIANDPYLDKKGTLDNGHVAVYLTDWDKQFTVDPAKDRFVDPENEHIIGYGIITFDRTMNGYEKFTIPIEYYDDRTPKFVVVVGSSSSFGDYFTGGEGSTLWLDEFRFVY